MRLGGWKRELGAAEERKEQDIVMLIKRERERERERDLQEGKRERRKREASKRKSKIKSCGSALIKKLACCVAIEKGNVFSSSGKSADRLGCVCAQHELRLCTCLCRYYVHIGNGRCFFQSNNFLPPFSFLPFQ